MLQICIETRELNGGFIQISFVSEALKESVQDIYQCIKSCGCLGIKYIVLDGVEMIQSVPQELNNDCIEVLGLKDITVENN